MTRGAAGEEAQECAGGEAALAEGVGFGADGVESGDGVRECGRGAEVCDGVEGGCAPGGKLGEVVAGDEVEDVGEGDVELGGEGLGVGGEEGGVDRVEGCGGIGVVRRGVAGGVIGDVGRRAHDVIVGGPSGDARGGRGRDGFLRARVVDRGEWRECARAVGASGVVIGHAEHQWRLRLPRWGVSSRGAGFHGLRPLCGLARGYVRVALRAGELTVKAEGPAASRRRIRGSGRGRRWELHA
ncbi:MAG: hypothetical protein ACF8R7_16340 [Phycisphaerales bacterium JB039]